MRHGTETWEEVLCGREETDENSLGHGREKQRSDCSTVGTSSGGVSWVPPRP